VGTAQGINPDCNGTATGSIRVTLTGNNGAVTYAWSNPALNGANPTALATGTYTVTLTDAAACKDTLSVTLLNPARLTLAATPASQPTPARPTGGSIALTYAGGTPAYRINWSPNGSDQSIGNTGAFTIPNLRVGAYMITLTDSKGCNAVAQATLSEPPCNLSIDIAAARADCGSSHLNTTVAGGTGPFQYAWNATRFNGQANPRNATPGTYTVTVTDAIGCSAKDSLVLAVDPSALIVSLGLINPLCPGDLGVFTLRNVSGGQGPFTLTLNNTVQRFNNPPLSVRNLSPGTFALNITNASGCSFDTTITIQSPRSLSLELGPDTTLRRGAKLTFKPQLNFTPSQISWSPPSGLTSAQSLNAQAEPAFTTTYTLLLSDSAGCKVSDKIQVLVAGQVEAYFPNAFSPNGDEVNDYFSGYGGDEIEALEYLRIFDRWGNLVFEGINIPVNDPSKGWDGTSRGQPSPIGLYVFSSVVRMKNGSTYSKAGEVNLVR
jgi:gliding motility-associated-like protein